MRVNWARGRAAITTSALALVVLLALIEGPVPSPARPSIHASAATTATFSLKGSAWGLFPGASRRLTVTVINPHRFAIRVTQLSVRVKADPRRPGCRPGAYLRVSTLQQSFRVPRRSRRQTYLRMRMLRAAPNACRSVRTPLVLSATARRP